MEVSNKDWTKAVLNTEANGTLFKSTKYADSYSITFDEKDKDGKSIFYNAMVRPDTVKNIIWIVSKSGVQYAHVSNIKFYAYGARKDGTPWKSGKPLLNVVSFDIESDSLKLQF